MIHRGIRAGILPCFAALGLALLPGPDPAACSLEADRGPPSPGTPRPSSPPGSFPLEFPGIQPNRGQADAWASHTAKVPGIRAWISPERVFLLAGAEADPSWMRLRRPDSLRGERTDTLSPAGFRLAGASPRAAGEEWGVEAGLSHYFLGEDPRAWATGVPRFRGVRVREAWPGVQVDYEARRDGLEYRFTITGGADPGAIRLEFEGGTGLRIDGDGGLLQETASGAFRHSPPRLFQDLPGGRRAVAGSFALRGRDRVGFEVGAYDRRLPLVIDPTITFASYIGGSGDDAAVGVAVDSAGATLLAGSSTSTNYRTQSALQGSAGGGGRDIIVTKVNASGSLVYSTYLGGSGAEYANCVRVDGSGSAYVGGSTASTNFPRQGALQTTYGGGTYDGVLAKIASNGASLTYSTYLGASGEDVVTSVAVDSSGAAYLSGWTSSSNFPLSSPLQGTHGGMYDAFATKVNPQGSGLVYSTFLGANSLDAGQGIGVDSSGNAYVAGYTTSNAFPVKNPLQQVFAGGDGATPSDAFLCELNATGSALVYSTFYGGTGYDICTNLAVDSSGTAYVVGYTDSTDFPLVNPVQVANGVSPHDAFIVAIEPGGASARYATFLGGDGYDEPYDAAVYPDGSLCVVGTTSTTTFPHPFALQDQFGGGFTDGFLTLFHPRGATLLYSTFYGGNGDDYLNCVALDGNGSPHAAGGTTTRTLPVNTTIQSGHAGGNYDVVFFRYSTSRPAAPTGLAAVAFTNRQINLSWADNSTNELAFEIERRTGSGPFQLVSVVSANSTARTDSGLLPSTTYTYRIRANNSDGLSAFTAEASATTYAVLPVPAAPTGLQAQGVSTTEIDVSWTDNSDNEQAFYLERRFGDLPVVVARTLPANATTGRDSGLIPARTYSYRVRASNAVGSTTSSGEVAATTLGSLLLSLSKGSVSSAATAGKGKLRISGTVVDAETGVPGAAFNPEEDGFRWAVGSEDSPLDVVVAPLEVGWKVSRGKYTWTSLKGQLPKAKFLLDTVTGKFSLAVANATYPRVPGANLWIWFGLGDLAGARTDAWRPGKKEGSFSFK